MAVKAKKVRPEIDAPAVALREPAVKNRDAEFRAFDGVVPQSGKTNGSYIPPCTFGKKQKLAEACKVKLFFAGQEAAAELSAKTGKDYEPGAYLRVCGPKTNDQIAVMPAKNVQVGMDRAASVCGCVEKENPASCLTTAEKLGGMKKASKTRRRAKR